MIINPWLYVRYRYVLYITIDCWHGILTYFDEELTAAAEALWPGLRPAGKAEGGEGDQVLVLILPKHRAPDNIDNQI